MITWAVCWLVSKGVLEGPIGPLLLFSMLSDIIITMFICMAISGGMSC